MQLILPENELYEKKHVPIHPVYFSFFFKKTPKIFGRLPQTTNFAEEMNFILSKP